MSLHLPALTTLVAVLLYVVTLANVAFARAKYKVVAPAVSGNPDFERIFRVQMNTLEQLVALLLSTRRYNERSRDSPAA